MWEVQKGSNKPPTPWISLSIASMSTLSLHTSFIYYVAATYIITPHPVLKPPSFFFCIELAPPTLSDLIYLYGIVRFFSLWLLFCGTQRHIWAVLNAPSYTQSLPLSPHVIRHSANTSSSLLRSTRYFRSVLRTRLNISFLGIAYVSRIAFLLLGISASLIIMTLRVASLWSFERSVVYHTTNDDIICM